MSKRKILALLLAVAMICSLCVSPALAAEDAGEPVVISDNAGPLFTDIEGHWSESAINRWAAYGIIQGDGDGTVRPNRTLKRDELATILTRLLGLKESAPAGTFTDVPADAWYADAVLKCAAAGIMLGDGAGHANPESPIDRQQTIVMVARALGAKASNSKSLSYFKDGDAVADWAAPYLAALTDMGILNGLPDGDGFVVAPEDNINRAGLFALLDKAIGQYVTTPTTVTVNDPNKFVVINTDAGEDVTVTGTTAGIVVGAGSTDDVILDNATVGTLKVDAPVNVIIKKGSAVTDLDANAAVKVENNGTVTNLNTNADDVTFDGNKPAAVNTAEDVEPAKDSKGNEVTTASTPSTGSSGSRPTSYKYKVSVASVTGGKVTANVTQTNTADTEVTLTVTPDAQKGSTMPYVLKSLTVMNGETEVTVTDNKFTMAEEGTYTVTAEFVQPIASAAMLLVDGVNTKIADMNDYGYPDNTDGLVQDDDLKDAKATYLFVGANWSEDYTKQTITPTVTFNGATKADPNGSFTNWTCAYVGDVVEKDTENATCTYNFDDDFATIEVSFEVDGAKYSFSAEYTKTGADATKKVTVTVKGANNATLATMATSAGKTVTLPEIKAVDGYYTDGTWKNVDGVTIADSVATIAEDFTGSAITIEANYVKVTDTTLSVRANGPEGNHEPVVENFEYSKVYTAAGLSLKGSKITVDASKLIEKVNSEDENLAHIMGNGGLANAVVFGVAYKTPAGAKKVAFAGSLEGLVSAANYRELATHPSCYDNTLISYIPVATVDPTTKVVTFDTTGDSDYCKWVDEDNNIVAVTKTVIEVETTNMPTFTVTFKADSKTVTTVKVDYNTALTAEQIPAVPAKTGYTGVWGDTSGEVLEDKTINATYTVIDYTLKYDVNGGEGSTIEDVTFTIESEDLTAASADAITKEGYTFSGWMEKQEFESGIYNVEAGASMLPADLIKLAKDNEVTLYANWVKDEEEEPEVITLTVTPYDFSCPDGTAQYITYTLKNGDEPFYIAASTVSKCEFRYNREADGEWTVDSGVELFAGDIDSDSSFEGMDKEHQLGWTVSRRDVASTAYWRFTGTDGKIYIATFEVPAKIANENNVTWGDTLITADKPVTAIPVTPENEQTPEDENA